jgi:hypothetical protein
VCSSDLLRNASNNLLSILAEILTSNTLNVIQNILLEPIFFLCVFMTEKRTRRFVLEQVQNEFWQLKLASAVQFRRAKKARWGHSCELWPNGLYESVSHASVCVLKLWKRIWVQWNFISRLFLQFLVSRLKFAQDRVQWRCWNLCFSCNFDC